MIVLYALAAALGLGVLWLGTNLRVVKQFERGVVFRFGRVQTGVRAPGLTMLIPIADRLTKVNMQIVTMPVPAQDGITRDNVQAKRQERTNLMLQNFFATSDYYSKALGVKPDWVAKTVESVGNYGEIFERNLGAQSALKLERGLNRLWTRGGLMYAPPFH